MKAFSGFLLGVVTSVWAWAEIDVDHYLPPLPKNVPIETTVFLEENEGDDLFKACALASIAVDFRITQNVDKTLVVHGMIPKEMFIHDSDTYWYRSP